MMTCTSFANGSVFLNGGNSFAANATLGTNDNFALQFETNSSTKMTILANGNVGIGNTNPTDLLEVYSTAAGAFKRIHNKNTDATGGAGVAATAGTNSITMGTWGQTASSTLTFIESNSSHGLLIDTYTNTPIRFATNTASNERMRIDANGLVGIGDTTPTAQLDVLTTNAATTVVGRFNSIPTPAADVTANLHGSWSTIAPSSAYNFTGTLYGAVNRIEASAGQTGTINGATGTTADVYLKSAGTINSAIGIYGAVLNTSTGTIGNAKAGYFSLSNTGGGTVTTGYGVYIDNVTGTSKWGLYQADATAPNYFAGKLGVNTNAPLANLHIGSSGTGASAYSSFQMGSDATASQNFHWVNEVTAGVRALRLYNGNLGSGTAIMSVSSMGGVTIGENTIGAGGLTLKAGTSDHTYMQFYARTAAPTLRSAWIGYGAAGTNELSITNEIEGGQVYISTKSGGAQSARITFSADGNAYKPGGGSWLATSDSRLKTDIKDFNPGLNELLKVHPVWFRYNGKGGTVDDGKQYVGVIAQELAPIAPYMVQKEKAKIEKTDKAESEIYKVDPSAFTYMIINSVKQLTQKFSSFENKVKSWFNNHEDRLQRLENQMAALQKQNDELKKQNEELMKHLKSQSETRAPASSQ
ncbi:tail fiber domain-containing protein [Bdellovibrio sp. 22V]